MTASSIICGTALCIALFVPTHAGAHSDSCLTWLKTAGSSYEQRDFDGTITLLRTALASCDLDEQDVMQAHKLLALSYLAIDDLEAADSEAEAMLRRDPNYAPDRFRDEPRYSALFERFTPVPVLRIGVLAGTNRAHTSVDTRHSIVHNLSDAGLYSRYSDEFGFQLGASVEYRVHRRFWVELQGQYRETRYARTLTAVQNSTVEYGEGLSSFDIPVSVKYFVMEDGTSPYVEIGGAVSFLTSALATTSRDNVRDIVDRRDYRNTTSVGYFAGAGVQYRMQRFVVLANVRYVLVNQYVNREGTRYADQVNVFKYYYIDDDFRMGHLQLQLGVGYTLGYAYK